MPVYGIMPLMETTCQILKDIPVVNGMGLRVESADAQSVTIRIPIEPNRNDKGTLFAGSSYSGLVLAGWLLAMNRARTSGFADPWAAVVDAHVHYAKPIRETVHATATFVDEPHLVPGARNWAQIRVTVDDRLVFEGRYAVGERQHHESTPKSHIARPTSGGIVRMESSVVEETSPTDRGTSRS